MSKHRPRRTPTPEGPGSGRWRGKGPSSHEVESAELRLILDGQRAIFANSRNSRRYVRFPDF